MAGKYILRLAALLALIVIPVNAVRDLHLRQGGKFLDSLDPKVDTLKYMFGDETTPSRVLHISEAAKLPRRKSGHITTFDLSSHFDYMFGCPKRLYLSESRTGGVVYERYLIEKCSASDLTIHSMGEGTKISSEEFYDSFPALGEGKILFEKKISISRTVVVASPYENKSGETSSVVVFLSQPPINGFVKAYRGIFQGAIGPYYGSERSTRWGTFSP